MEKINLLPIGSVIKLAKAEKLFMITGILQYSENDPTKIYDYLAVPYPEGEVGNKYRFTFNNSDIEKVVFMGYESEDREKFLNLVSKVREAMIKQ